MDQSMGKGPWERLLIMLSVPTGPLVVLGWPAVVLQCWFFRSWQTPEPTGSLVEWPLSDERTLLLTRQGHVGLFSLSVEQTEIKHSCPVTISARQRPITTRQRVNTAHMNEASQVKVVIHSKGRCCHNLRQAQVVNGFPDKYTSKKGETS